MSDPRRESRSNRPLRTLTATVALAGAAGLFLYGLVVGQQIEAGSGIEGVRHLWWLAVLPVVIGILVATLVTTGRATRRTSQDEAQLNEGRSDELERSKAATLARLTILVAPSSSSSQGLSVELEKGPKPLEVPGAGDHSGEHAHVAPRAIGTSG